MLSAGTYVSALASAGPNALLQPRRGRVLASLFLRCPGLPCCPCFWKITRGVRETASRQLFQVEEMTRYLLPIVHLDSEYYTCSLA